MYCGTPKALYNHVGLYSITTCVQHPLGWCDGCHRTTAPVRSTHTSYRWRGERVIEPIKWVGIVRRPWLTRASGGNLARTLVLHPTLYKKCHGIFDDHRESGPRFNVSSERRKKPGLSYHLSSDTSIPRQIEAVIKAKGATTKYWVHKY